MLHKLLFESIPAEFKSAFGLEESARRLRAGTRRYAFTVLAHAAAVGPVKVPSVRLQRVIPMVHNSFKPFFIGRFEMRDDGVYLIGKFTMLPLVKFFMAFWLAATIAIGIGLAVSDWGHESLQPLGPFAMAGFGIALIAFGKWFARNDIAWLSNVIRTALQAPSATSPVISPHVALASTETPTVLRVTAGVLLLWGTLDLIGAYRGFTAQELAHWQLSQSLLRGILTSLGIGMIGLAIGIYQRRLLAWRLGLVFLAAGAALSILQMFWSTFFPAPRVVKIALCLAMLSAYGVWMRWWYAQRVHFLPDEL